MKYKAWDKETKQMCIIQYLTLDFQTCQIWDGKNPNNDEGVFHRKFSEVELLQFTGLKDKNGKEIYEGDILQSYYNEGKEPTGKRGKPFAVEIGNLGDNLFLEAYQKRNWFDEAKIVYLLSLPSNCEIIGNIYSTPELLK